MFTSIMKKIFLCYCLCIIIIGETRSKIIEPTSWRPVPTTAPPHPSNRLSTDNYSQNIGGCDNNQKDEENIEGTQYYNETCTSDTQCYSKFPSSTICTNGVCTCADKYDTLDIFLGEEGTKKICAYAPTLSLPCQSVCNSPFTCAPQAGSSTKICQCLPPNKLTNGECHMSCKDNEYYSTTASSCYPKCKADEVLVDTSCYKIVELGSHCDDDHQCIAGYSECINRTCTCRTGFAAKNGTCLPQIASCPIGEPLKIGDNYKICIGQTNESCPDTHFCLPFDLSSDSGICCPRLKINCPFGQAHPTASCEIESGNYCPWTTYYCHTFSISTTSEKACCPRKCNIDTIKINNKCYSKKELHHSCQHKQQCTDPGTDCVEGFCECAKDYKLEKGYLYSEYCARQCNESETLVGDQCYQLLRLGDSCSEPSVQCPNNSYCDKKQRCSCSCGMIKVGPNVCASPPVCPDIQQLQTEVTFTPNYPTPETTRKEDMLKNVTFCKIKNKMPSFSVDAKLVDICQTGQYCASYLDNLGICCKSPEQVCPDGNRPTSREFCNTTNPLSCGSGNYCYQQLQLADPDSYPAGRFCCKT